MSADLDAQALALAAGRLAQARSEGYFPIACRTGISYNRAAAQSGWSAMCVSKHILPYGSVDLMPVYAGFATLPSEASISSLAGVHVGVAADFAQQAAWGSTGNGKGVMRRVSSGGGISRDLTVPTDGYLIPDPVACVRPAGVAMGCRIWVPGWGGAGTAFQASRSLTTGETSYFGTSASDLAWGGGSPATSIQSVIQPIAILGRAVDRRRHPALAIVGDSNAYGTRSTGTTGLFDTLDADGNSGWIERSLQSRVAFSSFATPGDRLNYWMNAGGGAGGRRDSRMAALRGLGYSHILLALNGTNDILGAGLTAAQVQDRWLNLLDELLGTGAKVWAATPFPLTTSSDTWATAGGQTLGANGAAIQAMADWIRANAVANGCERVIDPNAVLSDGSGRWRTDLIATLGAPPTYDGVHMSQAMTEWLAGRGVIAPAMLG